MTLPRPVPGARQSVCAVAGTVYCKRKRHARLALLWQGIVSNRLSALLLLAAGTTVGVLKARRPQWALPILYGLGASGLVAVIFLSFAGWNAFPKREVDEGAEHKIKRWVDELRLSSRREEDNEANFHLVPSPATNRAQIHIVNPKRLPSILVMQTAVNADQFPQIKLLSLA